MYIKKITLVLIIQSLLFASCATIPRATVDLSIMLDKQITVLEQSHVALIDVYFGEKEREIIDFLDNEWYPLYLDNFFNDSDVEEVWEEIINSPDKDKRITDLQMVVSVIQSEYSAQRESLLGPLEETRRELLKVVQNEYQKARTMNDAVLNNVASANEVQEVRNAYLAKSVDVSFIESTIGTYFDKANSILTTFKKGVN